MLRKTQADNIRKVCKEAVCPSHDNIRLVKNDGDPLPPRGEAERNAHGASFSEDDAGRTLPEKGKAPPEGAEEAERRARRGENNRSEPLPLQERPLLFPRRADNGNVERRSAGTNRPAHGDEGGEMADGTAGAREDARHHPYGRTAWRGERGDISSVECVEMLRRMPTAARDVTREDPP